jgi:hypothetical protein
MVAIGNSSLVMHAGAHAVSREEVFAAATPDATDTHFPIAHRSVLTHVQTTLDDLGWKVTEEAHAMLGDGLRYFGLLAIARSHGSADSIYGTDSTYQWVLGIRNAHDKSFAAEAILGTRVFVCDNLAFSGSGQSVFRFSRKHTRFIERDMPGLVAGAFGSMVQGMAIEQMRIDAYRSCKIDSEPQVHDLLVRAMDRRAITPQMLPHVLHEWRRTDGPGGLAEAAHEKGDHAFVDATAWRLLNCVTEVEKRSPSPIAAPKRNSRLIGLLDGLVGVSAGEPVLDESAN